MTALYGFSLLSIALWHFNISYALDMQNMKLHTYSFPAVADQSD